MIVRKWRKRVLKKISSILLIPLCQLYLSRQKKTKIDGISMVVKPGVFHPTLFFSTKYLLGWLKKQSLQNLTVLELGAGSGLLSIYAAKQGATVFAIDISKTACLNIEKNFKINNVNASVIQSDLFTNIPWQQFDLILINPPYYPKNPITENEYAWFCGEGFEYFQKLFLQMKRFMKATGKAIMVLSEDCDIERIQSITVKNNFKWELVDKKKIWFEENYLFEIKL